MKIKHITNHYQAFITDNDVNVANACFASKDSIEQEAEYMECDNSNTFLVVGLDVDKYRDISSGSVDFQEEYAAAVARMVYEMMLQQ